MKNKIKRNLWKANYYLTACFTTFLLAMPSFAFAGSGETSDDLGASIILEFIGKTKKFFAVIGAIGVVVGLILGFKKLSRPNDNDATKEFLLVGVSVIIGLAPTLVLMVIDMLS